MTDASQEDVLKLLSSVIANDRARAIATISQNPGLLDLSRVIKAAQAEAVPQLRRRLLGLVEVSQNQSRAVSGNDFGMSPPQERQSGLEGFAALEDVLSTIRHELTPAVGWIRSAARKEISDYEKSETEEKVQLLLGRIDSVVSILSETYPSGLRREIVDVRQVLTDTWPYDRSLLQLHGEETGQPLTLTTSRDQLSLIINNMYKNAYEASQQVDGFNPVQVSWGSTSKRFWIKVLNRFDGYQISLDDVLSQGLSSKGVHRGQGVMLIHNISRNLGFDFDLSGENGTAFSVLTGDIRSD